MRTCSVSELAAARQSAPVRILDVRELPEYAAGHVSVSELTPLSDLTGNGAIAGVPGEVYLLCRSGRRARTAAEVLEPRGFSAIVVEGGMDAWSGAGFPAERSKGPISLERQVRIAAGLLMLSGLLIPGGTWLSYFVACGLIFAGITDTCAMGMLLARLPWNRPTRGVKPTPTGPAPARR